MTRLKNYLTESIKENDIMGRMSGWARKNKKFSPWYKLYKIHIDDWFDTLKHYKDQGGKVYPGDKWVDIIQRHIGNEDYSYMRKDVLKLWQATQQKFKITMDNI